MSAQQVINGYRQLITRAHERGLAIHGCTLTPFGSAAYYSDPGETKREAINTFIRSGGELDAVIDFDKVVRDLQNPLAFLPAYDGGDHPHSSDAGYAAMGNAIDPACSNRVKAVRTPYRRRPRGGDAAGATVRAVERLSPVRASN